MAIAYSRYFILRPPTLVPSSSLLNLIKTTAPAPSTSGTSLIYRPFNPLGTYQPPVVRPRPEIAPTVAPTLIATPKPLIAAVAPPAPAPPPPPPPPPPVVSSGCGGCGEKPAAAPPPALQVLAPEPGESGTRPEAVAPEGPGDAPLLAGAAPSETKGPGLLFLVVALGLGFYALRKVTA